MALQPFTTTTKPPSYEEDEYYKSLPDQIGRLGVPQIGSIPGLSGTPLAPLAPQAPAAQAPSATRPAATASPTLQIAGGQQPQTTALLTEAAKLTGNPPPELDTPTVLGSAPSPINRPAVTGAFAGVDPNSSYNPDQARSLIEQRLGRPLTDQELQQAIHASGWTGSGPLTGAQMNQVIQAAAQQMGGTFTPWNPSTPQEPPTGTLPTGPRPTPSPGGTYTPEDAERQARERFRNRFGRDFSSAEWAELLRRVPGYQPGQPITQVMLDAAFDLIDHYDGNLPGGGGPPTGTLPPRMPLPAPGGDPLAPPQPYTPSPRTPLPAARPYVAPDIPWGAPLQTNVTPPPTFTAPAYHPAAAYDPGVPFAFDPYNDGDPFVAPTMDEALNDPGYQFGVKEGERALEQSAAAGGVLRTGGTLKDILRYGQDAATQRYGDVYNRKASEWERTHGANRDEYLINREGASDTYDRNAATGRYAHEQDVSAEDRAYAAAFEGDQAEFDPVFAGWQTETAANQRTGELNFDREHQQALYNKDASWRDYAFANEDEYRRATFGSSQDWEREQFDRNEATSNYRYENEDRWRRSEGLADREWQRYVFGTEQAFREYVQREDQAWRREVLEEERRRWLAELGTR